MSETSWSGTTTSRQRTYLPGLVLGDDRELTSCREKQYKDRLAAWHIGKNLKTSQVKFMIAKERKRAARGKKTAFRLHGQDVDPRKVARFARRKGLTWEPNKAKQPKKEERESPEPRVFILMDLGERCIPNELIAG